MNKECQIFTKPEYGEILLDRVGYNDNIIGKKVLENSFGDGQLLLLIVNRYIKYALNSNFSQTDIKTFLENDIYGVEIDEIHYKNCIDNLNELTNKWGIRNVRWKLFNENFFDINFSIEFDYIIGNPPYISYPDLDEYNRKFIKENFEGCKFGKPDYYHAFIEKSYNLLCKNGKLGYIIPNNFTKTAAGNKLRNILLNDLLSITDFKETDLFIDKVLTESIILIVEKDINSNNFKFFSGTSKKAKNVNKKNMNQKWYFTNISRRTKTKKCFGDYFKASTVIATQLNKAFVFIPDKEDEVFFYFKDNKVEKDVCRRAISIRGLNSQKNEYIIFPYIIKEGDIVRYSENEFKELFPNTFLYLLSLKDKLEARNHDKDAKFFEYGRSQAIGKMNHQKLLLSTLITKTVNVVELGEEEVPYSGIYIVSKNNISLNIAKKILQSNSFMRYVKRIGINANSSSLRISVKDINEYSLSKSEMEMIENGAIEF